MKKFTALSCIIIFLISMFSVSPMILNNPDPDYDGYEEFTDKVEEIIDFYFSQLSDFEQNVLKIIVYTCLDVVDYFGIEVSEKEIKLYKALKRVSFIRDNLFEACLKIGYFPSLYRISKILNNAPNTINLRQIRKCFWIVSSEIIEAKLKEEEIYGDGIATN